MGLSANSEVQTMQQKHAIPDDVTSFSVFSFDVN